MVRAPSKKPTKSKRPVSQSISVGVIVITWLLVSVFVPVVIARFVGPDPREDPLRPSLFSDAPLMTGSIFLTYFGAILLSIGVIATVRLLDRRNAHRNFQVSILTTIVLATLYLILLASSGGFLYLLMAFEVGLDAVFAMPAAIVLGILCYDYDRVMSSPRDSNRWIYTIVLPGYLIYVVVRMGIVIVDNIITNPFL